VIIRHRDFNLENSREWIQIFPDEDIQKMLLGVEGNSCDPDEIWRGIVTMEQFKQLLQEETESRKAI